MPQLRQGNVQPPQHPQHGQQPQRPQGPPRPPNNPQQVENNQARMMPPPQHNNQAQRQRQPPQQGEQAGNRSNPSSAHDASHAGGQQSHAPPIPSDIGAKKLTPPEQQAGPNSGLNNAQQDTTSHEPPVGFVTGRAAELLNAPPEARSGTVQAFNPHAESPSIRRTHGVNSGKSEPIRRTAIGSAASPPTNAANGAGAMSRTNFVNPSADMSRRIGMPGGGMQSPMANRGAYKPPTAVKRPAPPSEVNNARAPLADMSNMQQLDGANDPKKVKVEAAPKERENQLDGAVRTT
ncbi:DNA repair protein rad52 [Zalaria obscura]|uniref:DNA repair protein rad52 n=1 Tax=Zalaria obscura TaxID=2024903 RepID=A0ACC3SKZ7_9PEZI